MKPYSFILFSIVISYIASQDTIKKISNTSPIPTIPTLVVPPPEPISKNFFTLPPVNPAVFNQKCQGICKSINMNFPVTSEFTTWGDWYYSHGTPVTQTNAARMWAMDGRSEGMGFKYNFLKGKTYCIQDTFHLMTLDGTAPSPNTFLYVTLLGIQMSLPGFTPPLSFTQQTLLQSPFSTLMSSPTAPYVGNVHNFVANDNYPAVAFFPTNDNFPGVFATLTNLTICEGLNNNPCEFKVSFNTYTYCSRVYFIPNISLSTGLYVEGLIWDLGNGVTSNSIYFLYFYPSSGTYTVTLTVIVKNENGECCSKTVKLTIDVKKCDICTEIKLNTIKITNIGVYNQWEPNIYHQDGLIYKWNFVADSTSYDQRLIYKGLTPVQYNVSLKIIYSNGQTCCEATSYYMIRPPIDLEVQKKTESVSATSELTEIDIEAIKKNPENKESSSDSA